MSLYFGDIQGVEVIGREVRITGHNWVGLAFALDDAYQITRLVDVDPRDLAPEQVEVLGDAADVYDCDISQADGRSVVRVLINDQIELLFRCGKILKEFRYYDASEIREIFQWLPARTTSQELARYIADIKEHGFSVSLADGDVQVTPIK